MFARKAKKLLKNIWARKFRGKLFYFIQKWNNVSICLLKPAYNSFVRWLKEKTSSTYFLTGPEH